VEGGWEEGEVEGGVAPFHILHDGGKEGGEGGEEGEGEVD